MFGRKKPIRLRLVTRAGCHLCGEMKASLLRAGRGLTLELEEVDIDTDPALAARYGEEIPVLFVNGSKAFKFRASEKELRLRLKRERA